MSDSSLAPIMRAFAFFGFMGVAVVALTVGAGLQGSDDLSSASVAQTKIERNIPTDAQVAAVDARQRGIDSARRAIANAQQARAADAGAAIVR